MAGRGDRTDLEPADLEERVVLEYQVVCRQHGGVGRCHRHLVARIAYRRHGLDVVPVAVRLDDLTHAQVAALLKQQVVLVGGVYEESITGLLATHHEDVVIDGTDNVPMDLQLGVLIIGRGHEATG
jgi:hypothetical protein